MALSRPRESTVHDRKELRMFETEEATGLLLREKAAPNKVPGEGGACGPR